MTDEATLRGGNSSAGGLDHYRHSDWLGSARLTSSPSQAYLSSVAYAPFGETYAQSGSADLSFTGQNSDTVSGDYDFLFREYSMQGRWMHPDPAGLAAVNPANPQSWNRYSYVLNNPLALIDPLGLADDGCDPSNNGDQPCPKNVTENDSGGMEGSGCAADGIAISCGWAWSLVNSGTAAPCPNNGCSQLRVDPATGQWQQWIPTVTWTTGDDTIGYTIHQILGGWATYNTDFYTVTASQSGNSSWWSTFGSTFVNGVLHGVRQPGQSFGACILQNADETTFGGHKAVIGAVIATAAAAAADAPSVQVLLNEPPVSGALNIALYAGRFVYLASAGLISGRTVIAPIAKGIRAAGRAAPYVAAAEAGLLIGSAINCR